MDANQPKTRHRAQAARAAEQPINESQLRSFEKSDAAKHLMVKRVIGALRRAWSDNRAKDDEIYKLRTSLEEKQLNWPAVLIVMHTDGWCEIYADSEVNVTTLELKPWDGEDETQWKELLTAGRKFTYGHLLEGNRRLECYPYFVARPNQLTDEALMRVIEWSRRAELIAKIGELVDMKTRGLKCTTTD